MKGLDPKLLERYVDEQLTQKMDRFKSDIKEMLTNMQLDTIR